MESRREFFDELKNLRLPDDVIKEIILLHSKVKPSVRITLKRSLFDESMHEPLKGLLKKHGLHTIESNHRIVASKDIGKGGWTNKALKVVDAHSNVGDLQLYIARTEEMSDGVKALEFLDPDGLGRALGYPECCREFFKKYFQIANRKQCDFVLYTLSETEEDYPYDFYNNNASRYFGYSLLSHFPCSFNCRESSDLAKKYHQTLKKYSREWADTFLYYQRSAIVYTEYRGVFLIKNSRLNGNILLYNDTHRIYSTIRNRNLRLLNEGDNILIKSKNSFSVRRGGRVLKTFQGENVGLMIFR